MAVACHHPAGVSSANTQSERHEGCPASSNKLESPTIQLQRVRTSHHTQRNKTGRETVCGWRGNTNKTHV